MDEAASSQRELQLELARLRHREQELTALFSSARELAELRDSGAVLGRLVERAREMMRADIAYLSEFDVESRELRVRVSSGAVTPAFQELRVPPGRGLASAIVDSRSAAWVADYTTYAGRQHDSGIDHAVASEGVVSILGVPMLTSDDVIGVLFVANRVETAFAPENVAVLSALADHASVTLQTTQILHELQRSEDETKRALDRLTAHLAERDRANAVHQELVQAVLAGGGFSPVAETLASALARPVAIVDAREHLIAAAGLPLAPSMLELSEAVRDALAESRRTGRCVAVGDGDVAAVTALSAGAQHFGAILLGTGSFDLGAVDSRTVERAAQVGALLELQQTAAATAELRTRSDVLTDLLDDVPERRGDVERRASRLGVDVAQLESLVLFAVPADELAAAAQALRPITASRSLVGEYRGFVVAALPGNTQQSDVEQLRRAIAEATRGAICAVLPPPIAGRFAATFALAHRTARVLAALGISAVTTSTEELLPYAAALDTDSRGLSAYFERTIGAVRAYDTERGTDLLGTLRAFVHSNASPTRAGRALNFHTNTILQRLERLDHILGDDWRDDERFFRISVAVRLDEVRERLGGASAITPSGNS